MVPSTIKNDHLPHTHVQPPAPAPYPDINRAICLGYNKNKGLPPFFCVVCIPTVERSGATTLTSVTIHVVPNRARFLPHHPIRLRSLNAAQWTGVFSFSVQEYFHTDSIHHGRNSPPRTTILLPLLWYRAYPTKKQGGEGGGLANILAIGNLHKKKTPRKARGYCKHY